jgi:hypothetical protein
MDIECTGERIGDIETLKNEVDSWTREGMNTKGKLNEVYKEEGR